MAEMRVEDENFLIRAIRRAEVALFLGAGASATSTSSKGERVIQGPALARKLAEAAGMDYNNEPLPSVVSAVVPRRISKIQFEQILTEEFTRCNPSPEMIDLLKFSWHRIYTWNLDDVIGNCRATSQTLKTFNGMADPVTPNSDVNFVQVIHLHGDAWKLQAGYIFSEREYNDSILRGHAWYREAISDYAMRVPVFIGSRLSEPILSLELDRARPSPAENLGLAFLVTPDSFSPIQREELSSRGIVVIGSTLKEFTEWLAVKLGSSGISPRDVLDARGDAGRKLVERKDISRHDLATAQHVRLIYDGDRELRISRIAPDDIAAIARLFLEGLPPNWRIVNEGIPVQLNQDSKLLEQLVETFTSQDRLFVIFGQSGSGKTTAAMGAILRAAQLQLKCPVYEIGGDAPSLKSVINLLSRVHPREKIIVYFGASFEYGDTFAEDLQTIDAGRILCVGDARTREWKNHIRRRLEGIGYRSFEYQRFEEEDYDPLADAILKYVPAPSFHKLSRVQRRRKFAESKSQLLIALKEATHAKKFRDVIRDEFEALPNYDTKLLFLICGIGTLARTGVSSGMVKEVFDSVRKEMTYSEALAELSGIVSESRTGRLIARHELYVRHIVENVASVSSLEESFSALLFAFTKFEVPIIKSVTRQDGLLFKFCLNHDVLRSIFTQRSGPSAARRIYARFEVNFQRDGHYWLQYGQYLSSVGENSDALVVLERSIQAYPENAFAAHALADVQLKVAANAPVWDNSVAELIGAAVLTLEALHQDRSDTSDQYPIQTLADRHVDALVKHGKTEEAKAVARRYFNQIEAFPSERRTESLEQTRLRLLQFVTGTRKATPEASGSQVRKGSGPRRRRSRRGGSAKA